MVALILLLATIDPRLATLTTVFVQPVDPLEHDSAVVACVVQHLPTMLPVVKLAETPEEADAVIKVSARVNGSTSRKIGAIIGGAGSVSLGAVGTSAWIDGVMVWKAGTSVDAGVGPLGSVQQHSAQDDYCSLADASINDLRNAIKKARKK